METLLYRYRNITALLVAVFAQLILLAWQVRSENDVPLVRVWAITAVTPVASTIENVRNGTTGFFGSYFALRDARQQSKKFHAEVDRLTLENQLLKNELASAQRVATLAGFQAHTPSKMIGARVIGTTTGTGARSLLLDRGTASGIRKGMAVVIPAGIVGRVLAVYPFASQVLSVNDPGFAAGVESQKNHVHGVLKGIGTGTAKVDYVSTGQKVEIGELFFTSGEDRVFPKGLPVGKVTSVREGDNFQEIFVQPSGAEAAPEEVLLIVDPAHQEIPQAPPADAPVFLSPPLKAEETAAPASARPSTVGTQADKLLDQYRKLGESQHYTFGEGGPGSRPLNYNLKVPGVNAPAAPVGASGAVGATSQTAKPAPTGALGAATTTTQPPVARVPSPGPTGASGASSTVPRVVVPAGTPGTSGSTTQPPRPTPPAIKNAAPKTVPPVQTQPGAPPQP